MAVAPSIRLVFGHFQNLNLLVLMQDLRDGRTARHFWLAGSDLCPVAHGLRDGEQVMELVVAQLAELDEGCTKAAGRIGADPDAVLRFVRRWDEEALGPDWLLRQLEELWLERLEDAVAVQAMLEPIPTRATCPS
jgi:hypothetical protein